MHPSKARTGALEELFVGTPKGLKGFGFPSKSPNMPWMVAKSISLLRHPGMTVAPGFQVVHKSVFGTSHYPNRGVMAQKYGAQASLMGSLRVQVAYFFPTPGSLVKEVMSESRKPGASSVTRKLARPKARIADAIGAAHASASTTSDDENSPPPPPGGGVQGTQRESTQCWRLPVRIQAKVDPAYTNHPETRGKSCQKFTCA